MEFWRTILVLLRRPAVALPGILLPLGLAAATYLVIPTQYVSTATTVLTTSTNGGTVSADPTRPTMINPLRNFEGMKTAVSILIQVLTTPDMARQLGADPHGSTTYTVTDGSAIPQLLASNGPFIVIEGVSTSSSKASDIVQRVEQRLKFELISRQRALNAPPSTFLSVIDVVSPTVPEAKKTTKLFAAGGALVLGLMASTGIALLNYRRRAATVLNTPMRPAERPAKPAGWNGELRVPVVPGQGGVSWEANGRQPASLNANHDK